MTYRIAERNSKGISDTEAPVLSSEAKGIADRHGMRFVDGLVGHKPEIALWIGMGLVDGRQNQGTVHPHERQDQFYGTGRGNAVPQHGLV